MKSLRSLRSSKVLVFSVVLLYALKFPLFADNAGITIDLDHPTHAVSPTFYGLMTEEINHAYDGGLYAELIQNRAFKDNPSTPVHWDAFNRAEVSLDDSSSVNSALSTSLKCVTPKLGGVRNDGYWGIPCLPHEKYRLSFFARSDKQTGATLYPSIVSNDVNSPRDLTTSRPVKVTNMWEKYSVTITCGDSIAPSSNNSFQISSGTDCTFWLSDVSLFPPTFNNRLNGNRKDLMTLIGGLHPSFLRLPGGNYLEGNTLADYFPWKKTLGDIADRPGHNGPWGYRSSDGLGLLEFLEWCEDLKMQPVLAVYAGYALNGTHITPGPELTPYVEDALDEIQYLTGSTTSKWGSERAKNGHPDPFPLKYVEIGNEDGFDPQHTYDARFTQFYDAIKAQYPKLQIIATTHVSSRTPDVYDDHYYRSAAGNERDSTHYDTLPRNGPKIFVGEWASTEGSPTPNMQAALGDAAWLTGLERNSDIVVMEAYAPLLVRIDPGASQWGTNLIGYDGHVSFGSPSYYVQSVFAANTGDEELPVKVTQPAIPSAPAPAPMGAIGVGTWNTSSQFSNITVTHGDTTLYASDFASGYSEWKFGNGDWSIQDSSLTQHSSATPAIAYVGDPSWTDYSLKLKARKLSGAEGFLIQVHRKSDQDSVQFNFGGWGNSRTTIQRQYQGGDSREIAPSTLDTVQTNQWYDIRIDVSGSHIACYINDKLASSADDIANPAPDPLYACASITNKSGRTYLKVVNVSDHPITAAVNLQTKNIFKTHGMSIVITGDPSGQNSVTQPREIAPVYSPISIHGTSVSHVFLAHSVTVLALTKAGN